PRPAGRGPTPATARRRPPATCTSPRGPQHRGRDIAPPGRRATRGGSWRPFCAARIMEEERPPSGTQVEGETGGSVEATRAGPDVKAPPDERVTGGLTAAEVPDRVARGLTNRPSRSHRAEYWDILSRNLFTLFNALVVPAAIALFLLGEWRGGVAVSGFAVV